MDALVVAPVLDASEYTVSGAVWEALTDEINVVVSRIEAGEELVPEDVARVRQLKNQVDSYLSAFNKAMRTAQANYKELLANQLQQLGYNKIDDYIQMQRKKQTDEQNQRLLTKQTTFNNLVAEALENTKYRACKEYGIGQRVVTGIDASVSEFEQRIEEQGCDKLGAVSVCC